MILDERSLLSDKLDLSADLGGGAGAGGPSTNHYDLGALAQTFDKVQLQRRMFLGQMVKLLNQVTEDFASAAATGVQFILESDDDVNFGSPKEVLSITVPLASLVAGYRLPYENMPVIDERYFRMRYVPVGGTLTAGSVTSGIVAAVDGAYQG